MRRLILAALLLAACGQTGTIQFELIFPPGTDGLPATATSVRLRLSDPPSEITAPVAADGSFTIALDVPAEGVTGYLTFEALDAGGVVVARGMSAGLPIAAYSDLFRLFVAPPGSFAEAPRALDPARAELAVASLPYGAVLVGGEDAAGAPVGDLAIYNVYSHDFEVGEPLPEARAGLHAGAGGYGLVYLFGGRDAAGAPAADYWSFDTFVPPAGLYTALTSEPALATAGAAIGSLGDERFLVSGDPVVLLDGAARAATAVADAPAAARGAVTATAVRTDDIRRIVFAGADGIAIYDVADGGWREVSTTGRTGHAAVATPDGAVILIGGADAVGPLLTATRIDPASGAVTTLPALATVRDRPAAAVTGDQLVVAGGFDAAGLAVGDAEILDATTLAPRAMTPLYAPRGAAVAQRLPNGNILLVSGRATVTGPPLSVIELYTP